MKRIKDIKKLNNFIKKYNIDEIFNKDMRFIMELFLYEKNEYICKEGEPINYLYFFLDGKAKVYNNLSNGKALLLCFYHGLMLLGDLEMINPQPTNCNVQVIEETYCIAISTDNIKLHLMEDPKFLKFICKSLGEKLNNLSKNSSINLLYPLENRLSSYILATAETSLSNNKTTTIFRGNLTEISELLGASYRHLLRTLNTLCVKGCIRKKGSHYEVINEDLLKELAADLYR